jgi:hypothetical protein
MTVKKFTWFSLEKIQNSKDIIYPVVLPKFLPDILNKKYPPKPIEINLSIQPA